MFIQSHIQVQIRMDNVQKYLQEVDIHGKWQRNQRNLKTGWDLKRWEFSVQARTILGTANGVNKDLNKVNHVDETLSAASRR